MSSLSSHPNVWATCLELLERRGYRLAMELGEPDALGRVFLAERDGFTFSADNPIELLGLSAIYEDVRPSADEHYWWLSNKADTGVYERLMDEAIAAEEARHAALEDLRARDPEAWEARLRHAFDVGYDQTNAAAYLEVTRAELTRILEDPRLADLRTRPKAP